MFTLQGAGLGYTGFVMAVTTGTSVGLTNAPVVFGSDGDMDAVQPLLQAQDGSFIGTVVVGYDANNNPLTEMADFDQTGAIHWTVPGNYQPQIATADGGLIATDPSGAAVTFDQNGNATGVLAGSPTYSWTGNAYQQGSVDQVLAPLFNLALSWWPFAGGNSSGNGTANKPIAPYVQQLIAEIAFSYVGSTNWLESPGHPTCNLFVQYVLQQAGLNPPLSPNTSWEHRIGYLLGLVNTPAYPAQAGDWANPATDLKCWQPVRVNQATMGPQLPPGTLPPDVSIPGDIIAEFINYSDATGHVGIVVGPQQTASADSVAWCTTPGTQAGIIDITNFGFRPDGWTSPQMDPITGQPCATSGWKSKAVVKRFMCQ